MDNTKEYREALSGLKKLAQAPANDAVRLMARMGELSDTQIARLNLSAVSEIRRLKDGALEMKFFDRLKAFELLMASTAQPEGSAAASSFYAALESAAKTVCDADAV